MHLEKNKLKKIKISKHKGKRLNCPYLFVLSLAIHSSLPAVPFPSLPPVGQQPSAPVASLSLSLSSASSRAPGAWVRERAHGRAARGAVWRVRGTGARRQAAASAQPPIHRRLGRPSLLLRPLRRRRASPGTPSPWSSLPAVRNRAPKP